MADYFLHFTHARGLRLRGCPVYVSRDRIKITVITGGGPPFVFAVRLMEEVHRE